MSYVLWVALGLILIGFGIFVARRPSDFRIQRSLTLNSAPAAVFACVCDFHRWEQWSPWEKFDPAMKKTFAGPPAGVGSVYRWAGNAKAGEGCMTITGVRPDAWIRIQLEFIRPFKASNITEFTFEQAGGGTVVTWTMTGHNNVFFKAVHLVMNIDAMVGRDFENGLRSLQQLVEPGAGKQVSG